MTASKNLLRLLVVSATVALILGLVAELLIELPESLKAYRQSEIQAGMRSQDWLSAVFALSHLVIGLTASVALLFFWRPGRSLFLIAVVTGIFSTFSGGALVSTAWAAGMDEVFSLLSGAILALVYFSPLAAEFHLRAGQRPDSRWSAGQIIGVVLIAAGILLCAVIGFHALTLLSQKTGDAELYRPLVKGIGLGLLLIVWGVAAYRTSKKKHLREAHPHA